MEYLNLRAADLDSPQFIGADPIDRATWLCLMRYCVGQENSGTIAGCAGWTDRKWQQVARITLSEVKRSTQLWAWNGENVVVWGYPLERQEACQRLRALGKEAAEKRWAKQAAESRVIPLKHGSNGAKDELPCQPRKKLRNE